LESIQWTISPDSHISPDSQDHQILCVGASHHSPQHTTRPCDMCLYRYHAWRPLSREPFFLRMAIYLHGLGIGSAGVAIRPMFELPVWSGTFLC
jgi:hypothetical protein